jgi:acetoin utilization deacetylase AcuC-like enzyme
MIKRFQEIQPKIVCTLEGGYNLQWLGKCFLSQLGQLVGEPQSFEDPVKDIGDITPLIEKMKKELRDFWEL